MTALAATAAISLASPASAAVTVGPTNGTPLAAPIHASTTNAIDNALTVYGSTASGGASQDVMFTGDTKLAITNGGGFASITDSAADGTLNLYNVVINPDLDFTDLKFSIQLTADGLVNIYYLLTGLADIPSNYAAAGGSPLSQSANTNVNYLLTGGTFAKISIMSTVPIFEVKQNSINFASVGAVPEPATWAMMLLGFGGIGMAMRRSRRKQGARLLQIA